MDDTGSPGGEPSGDGSYPIIMTSPTRRPDDRHRLLNVARSYQDARCRRPTAPGMFIKDSSTPAIPA